jgi:hypothetical protein
MVGETRFIRISEGGRLALEARRFQHEGQTDGLDNICVFSIAKGKRRR